MDKNTLKSFAIEARNELIDKIKVKAHQYGIEKDSVKNSKIVSSDSIVINGRTLSKDEKLQREKLIKEIEIINEKCEDGYSSVIEEVAYTWFNRFTALRFMEVNNYMPTRVRPLSSTTPGSVEPDLIKEASNVNLPVDKQKIYELKLNNDMEALFKYMIIVQCNSLNTILPFMFEKIGHYTELLFPDGLLNEGAFIRRLIDTNFIPESDWKNVEIIGWLYQYYNSEEKDRVIKAKKKYKKEEIPFATQLFTPDWIVRYMVQNSLGRYWMESHPEHNELKKEWEFYIENPNPEPDFEEKLAPYINKELKVEDIKCFDPACGSGHILVYMFDVLYQIYEKCGYMNREIPRLIIENNLYGLDIDDKAYQLACFAVVMKGMKYNNRLLRSIEREGISLNIAPIQETNNLNEMDIEYIAGESSGENYNKTKAFIEQFKNAKICGSLIKIEEFDKEFLEKRYEHILNDPVEDLMQEESRKKVVNILPKLMKQTSIMVKTYDILSTNPPYIGNKYLNPILGEFISKNYSDVKSDIFSAFIVYSFSKVKYNGQLAFMTPFVWLFIKSYEKLRNIIMETKNIRTLIKLDSSGFEEATVPVCTFTLRNYESNILGNYIKLSEFKGVKNQPIKAREAIVNPEVTYRFIINQTKMNNIPGKRFGYWLTDKEIDILNKAKIIDDISFPCTGMQTGSNSKYTREWFEVKNESINFINEKNNNKYWIPYQMGGDARKWYGNISEVIYWKNNGEKVRSEKSSVIRNERFFLNYNGISWKRITSGINTIRVLNKGFIFDQSADSIFVKDKSDFNYILSFFNTKIIANIFEFISPTLNLTAGTVKEIPIYMENNNNIRDKINLISQECIDISREDWNSFETSWDFKNHPILMYKNNSKIEQAFNNWDSITKNQFYKLKENEEEINKIFIDIYELQDEITPEVEEKYITIRKADKEREIKSFISYAVGCVFGRYSLDQEGLVYAGGKFDPSKYKTFKADEDNIIPILSDSYFEDDIVAKFVEFVKVTFGEESLSENLNFIAEILGKKSNETAKDTIRRYFLNDFFKDHVQTYKKRPIYWLFTSGKQKAFNCLIYMHRYDKMTLSRMRTDYLNKLQDKLDIERKSIGGDYDTKEKNDVKKRLIAIDKQIDELKKYDEVLHHMADMQIEMDLDDGVKVNYQKFKGLLSKI
ncbi:BREX-1 system adenine-specific DNA-methyltransferase PglX [Clostridium autoethanogenum]|uniref:site-specific DNA-methyltransferase (adenine-specific) n=1 Tax=Clostridium autoethanogenum TaxID=84023 RepID=A0A3M0SLT3_9CLOT|nr:BREX-1 system adenine-specific DNA-methyltransferase PglX [Clostridium autoethanogenum]RMC98714.1 BREX-1 system adenine-specific DNA-methyltransferase PglX [Clostridium autoethanogenum]